MENGRVLPLRIRLRILSEKVIHLEGNRPAPAFYAPCRQNPVSTPLLERRMSELRKGHCWAMNCDDHSDRRFFRSDGPLAQQQSTTAKTAKITVS